MIYIYWVSNFINAKNISEIIEITGAPAYWFLTDMGPLTGGCHYAWACLGYTKECEDCIALENATASNKKIANENLNFKKKYLLKTNLTFITATSILEEQFLKSNFCSLAHVKFLLPINTEVFRPINKTIAKKYFSIEENAKVIFIGCSDFKDERKGMQYLSKALLALKKENGSWDNKILLLIAGNNAEVFIKDLPYNFKYLNLIKTDEALCFAYSSSNVFACPSIEDSGPMMINESLLCGTPIVAFKNVGVANDLVLTNLTGYLAEKEDISDFAYGLKYILELGNMEYEKMKNKCVEIGLNISGENNNTNKFFDLIKIQLPNNNENRKTKLG